MATQSLAAPRSKAPKIWTYDEASALPDGARFEIYNGALFKMPSPNLKHQNIVGLLYAFLLVWKAQNGGRIFLSPVDLYVSSTKYFIPDVVFYTRETTETNDVLGDPQRLRVAPDLVIEIVSPSTAKNDRVEKVREYAAFGVRNYWIISPDEQTLQAYVLRDTLYSIAQAAGDDDEFAPEMFPGHTLALAPLWTL